MLFPFYFYLCVDHIKSHQVCGCKVSFQLTCDTHKLPQHRGGVGLRLAKGRRKRVTDPSYFPKSWNVKEGPTHHWHLVKIEQLFYETSEHVLTLPHLIQGPGRKDQEEIEKWKSGINKLLLSRLAALSWYDPRSAGGQRVDGFLSVVSDQYLCAIVACINACLVYRWKMLNIDSLDGISVQAGIQVVQTFHLLLCVQTVRDHILGKNLLH